MILSGHKKKDLQIAQLWLSMRLPIQFRHVGPHHVYKFTDWNYTRDGYTALDWLEYRMKPDDDS